MIHKNVYVVRGEKNPWDPEMSVDYTGVSYFVEQVPLRAFAMPMQEA